MKQGYALSVYWTGCIPFLAGPLIFGVPKLTKPDYEPILTTILTHKLGISYGGKYYSPQ